MAVQLPVEMATRLFTTLPDTSISRLVRDAWNRHTALLAAQGAGRPTQRVGIDRRGHHFRGDAAIINVAWNGDGDLPDLDADLELVSFGPDATHLHLMGRYDLPPQIERFTDLGSLVHRVMVMTVRCFLTELGTALRGRGLTS